MSIRGDVVVDGVGVVVVGRGAGATPVELRCAVVVAGAGGRVRDDLDRDEVEDVTGRVTSDAAVGVDGGGVMVWADKEVPALAGAEAPSDEAL